MQRPDNPITTYAIAASGGLLFCSKGVFIKTAYAHGADPITVLALRMAVAFPFFLFSGWVTSRTITTTISTKDWTTMLVLGFIGYYLSSTLNFAGLQYISVGLERIVLFTFPGIVIALNSIRSRSLPSRPVIIAVGLGYAGILMAFGGEATAASSPGKTARGVALVFSSAITYAVFVTLSSTLLQRIGSVRFTAITSGFSCVCVFAHFAIAKGSEVVVLVEAIPSTVIYCGIFLGVFGTVVPSFLQSIALRRGGAEFYATAGPIGPLGTIVLAWIILGEKLSPIQLVGFAIALGGGLWISMRKRHS